MNHTLLKPFYIIFLSLVILGLSFSCKEEQTPLILLVSQNPTTDSEVGDVIIYNIKAICDEPLTSLTIKQRDRKNKIIELLDTIPESNNVEFVYTVPSIEDSSTVELAFNAYTSSFSQTISRKVFIVNPEELLTEYSGNMISSKLSEEPDGFNTHSLQSIFSQSSPDSLIDIADNSTDSINYNTLSCKWISPSGFFFARFNDYNYAQASSKSINEAYSHSVKMNMISNLKNDDILLYGERDEAYGAIRITMIVDTDSTLNDRYYFNIKPIK